MNGNGQRVVSSPCAPPDPVPLVREIADLLYAVACDYAREGSEPGSRYEGEPVEAIQARAVIRYARAGAS